MTGQVGLFERLEFRIFRRRHLDVGQRDVWRDALRLDRAPRGREVTCGGELERRSVADGQYGLHRALAERFFTHDDRAVLVLQRARDDLRGRGGAPVDEDHDRCAVQDIGGRGLELHLRIHHATLGVDDEAAFEVVVGHRHQDTQHTTKKKTQNKHHALQLSTVFLLEVADGLQEIFRRVRLELGDAQITVALVEGAALDALHLDHRAGQGELERLLLSFTDDREDDVGARLAAHEINRVLQREALHWRAVQADDEIAGAQPRLLRGRIVDGRHHLHEAVFHGDFDAETAELASGADLQFFVRLRVEIRGVGIEVGQHAADGVLQLGLVVHRLDIVALDLGEDLGEGAQIVERNGVVRRGFRLAFGPDTVADGNGDAEGDAQGEHQDSTFVVTHELLRGPSRAVAQGGRSIGEAYKFGRFIYKFIRQRGYRSASVLHQSSGFTGVPF